MSAQVGASLVAQTVKNPPAMWENCVQSLEEHGNPLQYSCLENPYGQRSCWAIQSMELHRLVHSWATKHTHTQFLK